MRFDTQGPLFVKKHGSPTAILKQALLQHVLLGHVLQENVPALVRACFKCIVIIRQRARTNMVVVIHVIKKQNTIVCRTYLQSKTSSVMLPKRAATGSAKVKHL